MKAKNLGFAGEKIAEDFLRNKKYEILEKNFTVCGGEIDIIARLGKILVFVEVKTRTGKTFGSGDESMNGLKKMRIAHAIQRYLDKIAENEDPDYRVDLIEIDLDPATLKLQNINHYEDIEL